MAQNGGAGRGQGRKPGGLNKRTLALRAVAESAIASGITPLEVLLKNMRYFDSKGELAEQMLAAAIERKDSTDKMIGLLKELCNFKSEASKCAVDAAPYCHARLNSITISGDPDNPLVTVNKIERTVAEISHIKDSDAESVLTLN